MTDNINARIRFTAVVANESASISPDDRDKAIAALRDKFGDSEVFALLQRFSMRKLTDLNGRECREFVGWARAAVYLGVPPSSNTWTVKMLCDAEEQMRRGGAL